MGINTTFIRKEGICPHCVHDGAWSRLSGTFCSRCKKDVNDEPLTPKPLRGKGVHPKAKYKRKIRKLKEESQ